MALSQPGAGYSDRNFIRDPHVLRALDDIASQVQSVAKATNAPKTGVIVAPSPPDKISVSASSGMARVSITHNNPPAGVAYILEHDTSPNFSSPNKVQIDNGVSPSYASYLKGQTLYFRAASTLYTSKMSSWVYFGPLTSPTPTTF